MTILICDLRMKLQKMYIIKKTGSDRCWYSLFVIWEANRQVAKKGEETCHRKRKKNEAAEKLRKKNTGMNG